MFDRLLRQLKLMPKRWLLVGGLLILLGVMAGGSLLWIYRDSFSMWLTEGRLVLLDWLEAIPLYWYVLAFVVLPAVGVPLTFFYLTVGAVAGSVWLGLGIAWVSLTLNMILSYGLSHSLLRPLLTRILARKGVNIPEVKAGNAWKWVMLFRLSPVPWVIQNYVLGLSRIRFGLYVWLSLLIQGTIGAGMIVVGGSLFEGKGKFALLGVFLIVLVGVAGSALRRRLNKKGVCDVDHG